ncbi:NAD-dependent epimerase/dehydratase family protein [Rhodothermus sp. AH-315-K08]|nr:NAD-dependent epimerase/dehydratase family protein [Rhodothermus sp. AH-315-K08]
MEKRPISLVTGIGGFIGSHVADELKRMGHLVVGLDDLSGGNEDNVPDGTHLVVGSITDHELVNRIFQTYRPDYVFHLAAYAAEGLSHFIRRFNYQNNLIGSVNLINATINVGSVKCFVFTSSMAVYGSNQVPMREDMTPKPEDPYGAAKYCVELDLKAAHEMFGLDYVIIRPHNVYGERQNTADRYRNVIGIFMNKIMHGDPMTVFGDGMQTRAFSYISDVAPIIARTVERPECFGEIMNVGADRQYTILELAEAVAFAFDVAPEIVHLEERYEVKHAYTSHDQVERMFSDLRRHVPLDEGLKRMANWAKGVGAREPSRFGAIEIRKHLYDFWKFDDEDETALADVA